MSRPFAIDDVTRRPVLSFPPFRLDLVDERLWKGGEELRLRRKPFEILRYLATHPSRLVTHAEIVDAVWGRIVMSESLLRGHVHDLRKVLGTEVIQTVLGRGYRFHADVEVVDEGAASRVASEEDAPLPSVPVVGRDAELEVLHAALRRARHGQRSVVFVTGEAGTGKTALLDAFLGNAGARKATWIARGACIEQCAGGEPYFPVLEALGALCRRPGGERVLDFLARYAPMWLLQMPGLVAGSQVEELHRRVLGATPARMIRELAEVFEALSVEAPVVLVLDDLHWSDPATADLVAVLGKRREPARLVVVGTLRPDLARDHPIARIASDLIGRRCGASVPLGALDDAAVSTYVAKRVAWRRFLEIATAVPKAVDDKSRGVVPLFDEIRNGGLNRTSEDVWEPENDVASSAARRPESPRRPVGAEQRRRRS